MAIIYQLIQFYLLIWIKSQQCIFVITVKSSTMVIRSTVRVFPDNFRRSINRFSHVALYFLLLILTVDSCFVLFMRLFVLVLRSLLT